MPPTPPSTPPSDPQSAGDPIADRFLRLEENALFTDQSLADLQSQVGELFKKVDHLTRVIARLEAKLEHDHRATNQADDSVALEDNDAHPG